jgi:hypothetical protein
VFSPKCYYPTGVALEHDRNPPPVDRCVVGDSVVFMLREYCDQVTVAGCNQRSDAIRVWADVNAHLDFALVEW